MIREFARREFRKVCSPRIEGHLIRKSTTVWQILDDSGIFAPSNAIIKKMRHFSMFGSNHKMLFGKLIGRHPLLSLFCRTETLLKMISIAHLPCKFYKSFHAAAL